MANNAIISCHTFHNESAGASTGIDYNISSAQGDTMKLEFIVSESGTFSATVKAQLIDSSKWYTYPAIQQSKTFPIDSVITDANYLYEVDLRAISKLRVDLTAITTTITVYGKVVG